MPRTKTNLAQKTVQAAGLGGFGKDGKQEIKQSPIQDDVTTFTARGVDRDTAKRIRIHATATEQTLGVIVTAALQDYLTKHAAD